MWVLASFIKFLRELAFAKTLFLLYYCGTQLEETSFVPPHPHIFSLFFILWLVPVCKVQMSLASTGKFGKIDKFNEGRLDHYIKCAFIMKPFLVYSQTCVNGHLWIKSPVNNNRPNPHLAKIYKNFSISTSEWQLVLNNSHYSLDPRVAVVHRFDCMQICRNFPNAMTWELPNFPHLPRHLWEKWHSPCQIRMMNEQVFQMLVIEPLFSLFS